MSWRRFGLITADVIAILAGLAISTPFFLIVWAAFSGGL
jgi:hypothetical protein